jgi:RNA polymerase sigma-70 factor, ECF subfamily
VTAAPVSVDGGVESAEAANELYERYHDRIYAFCMSRTRNPTDAEDATQTSFMHALNGLRRGVVPEFELTWLLKIAENVCHSMHRRAYRRYERDELPVDLVSRQDDLGSVTERFDALCVALESLPDTQRRAMLLREWRGLSYNEIADELEVSHAAVETMLFRARRSLVKQLGSLGAFPFPAIGRLLQWLAGPAGAKAAAVAVVTIATATAVVSSAPAEAPLQARAERPSAVPVTTQDATRATRVDTTPGVRAPGTPTSTPVEPGTGPVAEEPSAPATPVEPGLEPPASEPTVAVGVEPPPVPTLPSVLPLPSALPLPAVPDPTEVVAPVVELTNEVVEQTLPVELPPLVPKLPLP